MGKFVVDKSCRQQPLAFAARNQKSKAGRKRLGGPLVVAQAHRDRRAVLNGGEFAERSGLAMRSTCAAAGAGSARITPSK